jgi:hypothetical protein
MKISIFATEDAMQFNLMPESQHEIEMFKLLEKFSGQVSIGRGSNIGMCMGGYIRSFGMDSNALTITIDKEVTANDQ